MVCCLIGVIIKLTTSQNTHDISLASVIRTSMDFFYENPIGRILNRFTKDTDVLDDELGRVFKLISTRLGSEPIKSRDIDDVVDDRFFNKIEFCHNDC